MKRSASLPHIPIRPLEPVPKRPRHSNFESSKSRTSLLLLSDDLLIRIFRLVLKSEVIDAASCAHLGPAISLGSSCRRLRHLFFTSIRILDGTVEHARHDLPHHYHNLKCTTCPSLIRLPLLLQLIKRTALSLRILRLPPLNVDSTTVVLSTIAERCLQLRELRVTDRGGALVRTIESLCTLRHLEICEPSKQVLSALSTTNNLSTLCLHSVSPEYSELINDFLCRKGRSLHSLTMAFHNARRFLPEPFAFPRFNLHRVYPDLHLDVSKGVSSVLDFIAHNRQSRLPLLQHLTLHTVGVDLNQESCDLINCPPPFKSLDSLAGTVQLIRNATMKSAAPDGHTSLCTLDLRTDHPLLQSSLTALAPLLTPRLLLTLHVHELTLIVPPAKPDALTFLSSPYSPSLTATPYISSDTATDGSTLSRSSPKIIASQTLWHSVVSARLESLLNIDASPLSRFSNFSQLRTLDVSSSHFCVEYGRNVDAHRPRLISLLKQAENSLTTIRIATFLHNGTPDSLMATAFLVDVLCHAPKAKVLELSDEFLITALYDNNLTDVFLHLRNIEIIRFGGLKWTTLSADGNNSSIRNSTAAMTQFFQVLPLFLYLVRTSCPCLKSLVLLSMYPPERASHIRAGQPLRDAVRALNALEHALPDVDAYTVRIQLQLWSAKGLSSRS